MGINNSASSQAIEATPHRGYGEVAQLCQDSIGALMASGQAAICGVQDLSATLLAFAQCRAKDGLEASQQLAACRSPEDVVEVQLEHAAAALQAWADEFARLNALNGRIVADLVAPLKSQAAVAAHGAGTGKAAGPENGVTVLAA